MIEKLLTIILESFRHHFGIILTRSAWDAFNIINSIQIN